MELHKWEFDISSERVSVKDEETGNTKFIKAIHLSDLVDFVF